VAQWRPKRRIHRQAANVSIRRTHAIALVVVGGATLQAGTAAGADSPPYFLRNHSPFLQVFGLPSLEGGALTASGALETRVAFNVVNHADSGENGAEAVVLDGETYYVDTVFRYGLGERWEVGLDLPYVAHRNGTLDNLIEGWHDFFGLDNSERQGPSNHLQLTYTRDGVTHADLRDGGGGIGDVRVTGAYQLLAPDDGGRSAALRAVVKLPTGDEERLRGSGATDLAMSFEATDHTTLAGRTLELSGQAGALLLGSGDLLRDQQKSMVPFASFGAIWHWREAVGLRVQLALQGKYFDSGLDEIGGTTATLALGSAFRLRRLGVELDVALIEDLISDATPDFGLYVSVRRLIPQGRRERQEHR
jgi:hypothetical protein